MAKKQNKFPQTAIAFPSGIKTLNKDPQSSGSKSYFLLDSLSVDFRIQGFIDSTTTNAHVNAYKKDGIKFIISDASAAAALTSITDKYDSNASTGYGPLSDNDVIVWNSVEDRWELWFDTTNAGISGASGGAFGYVVEENKFYGFFGSGADGGWDTVGEGGTGATGNTGPAGVFGRKYTQTALGGGSVIDTAGELNISNTIAGGSSHRDISIFRYNSGDQGFGGVTGDLFSICYPNGTGTENDGRNPKVTISLYNETKNRTFSFRADFRNAAVSGNVLTVDGDKVGTSVGDRHTFYEEISQDGGAGAWTSVNAWDDGDEIYLTAIADGLVGVTGADGATGQGITFAGLDAGELQLQYLDANGNPTGSPFDTGIISGTDGVTGDPGEVGFLMAATGASGGSNFWGNNLEGKTAEVAPGQIYYTKSGTERLISLHYDSLEVTNDLLPSHFGFTAGEIVSGTEFKNKPGSLYFYEQLDKKLVLRSFVKYSQARTTGNAGSPPAVILKGITDTLSTFNAADEESRLGITLGAGLTKEIFVLPIVEGLKGVGITFGKIENNTLFLDYIDENGNTFGRFSSIEGITGPQGSLNPFNIPFLGIKDPPQGFASQGIQVVARAGGAGTTAAQVKVSTQSADSDTVTDYLKAPLQTDAKSGFLSVFDVADVANFGIFRFRDGTIDAGNAHVIYGTGARPLIHVAGNISNIIDITDDTKGFTSGERFLFALNTDGPRGFSGAVGIGFTYGNEYFATNINNKPQTRSDGNPLEIGDKWYCLDAGLEFTYLGTSADNIVEFDPAGDAGGATNDRIDIWVQTNNARQGKQGPKGDAGTPGTQGTVGATGIDIEGVWNGLRTYSERDSVYINFASARQAAVALGPSAITRVEDAWAALGAGTTNGYFVVKQSVTASTAQIPGNFTGSGTDITRWNSSDSDWSPVVVNQGGLQGSQGVEGPTGASITNVIAVPSGSYNVYFGIETTDEDGNSTTLNVRDSSNNSINFRGPTGPPGSIDASENQFLVSDASDGADGTNTIVLNEGKAELREYRERVSTSGVSINSSTDEMTIDIDQGPVIYHELLQSEEIDTVKLSNCDTLGDGVTVYIRKPSGMTVTWNANSASAFKLDDTTSFTKVFVSSQGFPTPGKIEFEASGTESVGAFTFKMIENTPDPTLVVNYVSFVVPSAT